MFTGLHFDLGGVGGEMEKFDLEVEIYEERGGREACIW
jgi:hypothetical protein